MVLQHCKSLATWKLWKCPAYFRHKSFIFSTARRPPSPAFDMRAACGETSPHTCHTTPLHRTLRSRLGVGGIQRWPFCRYLLSCRCATTWRGAAAGDHDTVPLRAVLPRHITTQQNFHLWQSDRIVPKSKFSSCAAAVPVMPCRWRSDSGSAHNTTPVVLNHRHEQRQLESWILGNAPKLGSRAYALNLIR